MSRSAIGKIIGVCVAGIAAFALLLWVLTGPEKLVGVAVPKEDEPYVPPVDYPADTTVLLGFPDGYAVALELCFAQGKGRAVLLDEYNEQKAADYGFFTQHTWRCDYTRLIELIDQIGGLTLASDGQVLCHTGVQVCRLLDGHPTDESLRVSLLKAAFEKICKTGFSSETLSCIIEASETDLSVPVCFGWTEHLPRVVGNINVINEE